MPSTVDKMIGNYREYIARCAYLEHDIKEAERLLVDLRNSIVEDSVNITVNFSDMPHGQGISDPTGRLGLMLASGYETDYVKQLEQDINARKMELREKIPTVSFVTAWIRALDNKERLIIQEKVIGGLSWRQMVFSFQKCFGDIYSQQGLKRIKGTAMQKIYTIAK